MNTKTFFEFELAVEFDYSPPQMQSRTDPAFPATVDITSVMLGSLEILPYLTPEQRDKLEDDCWEEVYAQLDCDDEPPERIANDYQEDRI